MLDRGAAGGRGRSRSHGTLGLGLRLRLHLGQSLLVDHEQLATLTTHQNHTCTDAHRPGSGTAEKRMGPTFNDSPTTDGFLTNTYKDENQATWKKGEAREAGRPDSQLIQQKE